MFTVYFMLAGIYSGKEEKAQESKIGVTYLCGSCSCPIYDETHDEDILLTLHLSRYREAYGQDSQIWENKILKCLSNRSKFYSY